MDKKALNEALKTNLPVILGYLPSGFAFGLMMSSLGQKVITSGIMAILMYAGAGQYIAVDFIKNNSPLITIIITTFLINCKHLFYGLSLIETFSKTGRKKPFLIFLLTDETYALLTGTVYPKNVNTNQYIFYVAVINYLSWIAGCVLGAVFGSVVKFDTTGLDFAMTALFLVILTSQLKTFTTKYPFIIGAGTALFALMLFGKGNILLGGAIMTVILLVVLRERIEKDDNK